MKWILKAVVQKVISWMPNSQKFNYWFQKNITKGVQLTDAYLEDRLIHFRHHLNAYQREKGSDAVPAKTLELGTGWYPVIPFCFFLAGTNEIRTIDISGLLSVQNIQDTIRQLTAWHQAGRLQQFVPVNEDRFSALSALKDAPSADVHQLLKKLNVSYLVKDARNLGLPDNSIDFITSNNTFEHIYPDILKGILVEFQRVLKPDGLSSHFIDMSDHFAHLDGSITIYNFLKFSEKGWNRIDNDVQPQNRWRLVHYRELYSKLNIPILSEENRPGDLKALKTVKIHPELIHIPAEELAISHSYVLSGVVRNA